MASSLVPSLLSAASPPKRDRRPVALLLPLTGERGALGTSMAQAAALAESDPALLVAIDTAGGAAAATRTALGRKPAMILGPLLGEELVEVAALVQGRVPLISFTNDAARRSATGWAFGISAGQATTAILRYARGRGVRSLVTLSDGSPWTAACAEAALAMQGELGMTVRTLTVAAGGAVPDAGEAPDAMLLPGGGASAQAAARALKGSGVQLLATVQAVDHTPAALDAFDGAWLASPDPRRFAQFARDYEARHGGRPGALAALAYDAAGVAHALRTDATIDRAGLLAGTSFPGVAGAVRFRSDGSVSRELSILVTRPTGYETVATSQGA